MSQEIQLELGFYKDWKSDPPDDKETVKARAISPAKPATNNSGELGRPVLPPSRTAAAKTDAMDDEIPFALAFLAVTAGAWLIISNTGLIA